MTMSPTPLRADQFAGDIFGFLAWAAQNWVGQTIWCPAHWAPCPVEGLDGIFAQQMLKWTVRQMMPPAVQVDVRLMNEWMAEQGKPMCCVAGDERLERLWGQARSIADEQLKRRRL